MNPAILKDRVLIFINNSVIINIDSWTQKEIREDSYILQISKVL